MNTNTEKPLHAFSGQRSDVAFICGECFTPMTCDHGPTCSHDKLSILNPIITWENVDDWCDALASNFALGQGDHLSDARRLSQFLLHHTQALSDLSRMYQLSNSPHVTVSHLAMDRSKLRMLEMSMSQKVSRIQSMIQFGVIVQ